MRFEQLSVKDYPRFLALYNEAFPANERRLYEHEKELDTFIRERHGKFHAFSAVDGEGVGTGHKEVVGGDYYYLGFMSYWTFKDYVYIEHFAVSSEQRGRRIGTKMLEHLFKEIGDNVLIEVEYPDTPEAERRIKFYERNGFRVRKELDYEQPPYSKDQQPVKMLLMTHGDVKLNSHKDIEEMLHEVYNVEHKA